MEKNNPVENDRDQQILRRLSNIEFKVESLDQTTAFAMKSDYEKHISTIKKIFGNSKVRAQAYLAADSNRTVNDISELLNKKMPNISPELSNLQNEGLLEVIEKDGSNIYYGKKKIEKILSISKFLMNKFNLNIDGSCK